MCFSYSTGKTNFANEYKCSFPPTFVLPVAEIVLMCDKMVWLALFTERCLGQPIITYMGAKLATVSCVGKNSQSLLKSDCLTSDDQTPTCNNCFCSKACTYLFQRAQVGPTVTNYFSESHIDQQNCYMGLRFLKFSPCPFIGVNKTMKWLFVF